MAKNSYTAIVEKEGDLYVALCPELDFNLTTVIQLPPGAFAPYAETARTNILFFDSSRPSSDIWYYQYPRQMDESSVPKAIHLLRPTSILYDYGGTTVNPPKMLGWSRKLISIRFR